MYPLNAKQQKSTRLMNKIQPEMKEIQKKYKGKKDQASQLKMNEETQALYAKVWNQSFWWMSADACNTSYHVVSVSSDLQHERICSGIGYSRGISFYVDGCFKTPLAFTRKVINLVFLYF